MWGSLTTLRRSAVALLLATVACSPSAPPESARPSPSPSPPASAGVLPSPSPTVAPAPRPPAQVLLDIVVWDDTKTRPLGKTEVWVRGQGSWFPQLRYGGDGKALGEYPVGQRNRFFLYPDGRGGREIRVVFRMRSAMISGSDQAQTVVSISDRQVEVTGQAIPGRTKVFPR